MSTNSGRFDIRPILPSFILDFEIIDTIKEEMGIFEEERLPSDTNNS